ncbi:MAG: hypothetical protein Q9159_000950 [Coniocarpon cinnabarinum]
MAAPQIPNLLESLRKSKAAGNSNGLRGGPRRGPALGSSDAVIQQTDDDAAGSRLSAVDVGYLQDKYARALSFSKQNVRRMPIINRGTYVRTVAIDALVQDYLGSHQDLQIISLGAGTDTRPFRLFDGPSDLRERVVYHEIDFPDCTRKKITAINNANLLNGVGFRVSEEGTRLASPAYNLHPLDLRKLGKANSQTDTDELTSDQKLALLPGVDPERPTLLASECCLTYLNSSVTVSILRNLSNDILKPSTPISIILYEPLHPDDAFGRTMTSNLSARGISLPGLEACPTLKAHEERLKACGFETSGGMLVKKWWRTKVSDDEKDYLRNLEGLDEEEEWELLAGHYGFIWGSRGTSKWPSV